MDEIGDLPIELQGRLLRAIERREIRAIGSTITVPFAARLIAATNRNLRSAMLEETFREDLYYRLNVLSIKLPPLRDRRIDIPMLAQRILENLRSQTSPGVEHNIPLLSSDALDLLLAHDWPGNVRELRNCLESAVVSGRGSVIHAEDIELSESISSNARGVNCSNAITPLRELEKTAILQALSVTGGDKMLAARLLGIGKTTLYRRLQYYALK
jgi:two-component system response regulator HydG